MKGLIRRIGCERQDSTRQHGLFLRSTLIATGDAFARFGFGRNLQGLQRRVVGRDRTPAGAVDRQTLLAEHGLELGPDRLRTRHGERADEARILREARADFLEILLMVGRELELAADLKALPERGTEERTKETVRMMLLLRPGVGEEHVDLAGVVFRQKIMERIERLKTQDVRIVEVPAFALAVEETDALKHAFDAKELAVGMLRGAPGEELSLATADFNLEGTRQVELEGLTGIGNSKDMVGHLNRNQ